MKIALFGKKIDENWCEVFRHFLKTLSDRRCEIAIYAPFYDYISHFLHFESTPDIFSTPEELKKKAEVVISFGGDGTILDVVALVQDSGIPVLGVNIGRLGFLSATSVDEFEDTINKLISRNFELEPRSLLRLTTEDNPFGKLNYALNDVSIFNNFPSKMLSIGVWIDGHFLNNYWGDGLIVATPTGSTAYSLSCGGNILTPSAKNFIITPIAPHNLTVRSIIISDESKIKIQVQENRSDAYIIALDSRSKTFTKVTEILIEKEKFEFNLIQLKGKDFFQTLRNKLLWGLDKRN